jgi:hypothetical protein
MIIDKVHTYILYVILAILGGLVATTIGDLHSIKGLQKFQSVGARYTHSDGVQDRAVRDARDVGFDIQLKELSAQLKELRTKCNN